MLSTAVFSWAPVWLPCLVIVQLASRGLASELREDRRLGSLEVEMSERVDRLESERTKLERDLEKLADPVYHERVRRSRMVAGSELLTLEHAHVGVLPPR